MTKKTIRPVHLKPVLVNLMYLGAMIFFALFFWFSHLDSLMLYDPLSTNQAALWTALFQRAAQLLAPGIGLMVLATIWNNRK